jgi:hypothetical protein
MTALRSASGARVRVNGMAVLETSGASAMAVGLALAAWVGSTRSITPGLVGAGTVVRNPAWSTKANTEGAPEAVSRVPTETSDAFSQLLPTT